MPLEKYYDYKTSQPIDIATGGCPMDKWADLHENAQFARHPKGFLVFLPPDALEVSDEYKDADPYTVEINSKSDFHDRRIGCTLEMLRDAAQSISGHPEILDLGCGQGHITQRLRDALPEAGLSGLDYSVSAIEYAVERFPGIDFIVGNAYEPPYTDNYFDIVVCNNLWEHVPDPLLLLRRITRILKPGGFLIMSTPSRYRLDNLLRVLQGKPVRFMSEHHVTEYSVGQVLEQLAYGGFEVQSYASKSIRHTGNLKRKLMRQIFAMFIYLTGSHHNLESTVFYLARNKRHS